MPADKDSLVDLDEIVSMLRAHEGPPQAVPRPPHPSGDVERRRPRPSRRLRFGVAGAAAALLLGSGLGFGVGSSVTPNGSAGTPFAGFGFLPARGWTVVQSGTLDTAGAATAIAANVPLHREDGLGAPEKTLESLPPRGIVIHVTFTTRGDPGEDFKFADRRLPLRATDARPVPILLARGVAGYRITAGVRGYNLDAGIYYGSWPPSAQAIAAAQRQLERLVVASEGVTIFARPTIVSQSATTLFGSVDSGKAGEIVDIQAKDCGQQFFRGVVGVTTGDGGTFSTQYWPGINTTLRAVWKGNASVPVKVQVQAAVGLRKLPRGRNVLRVSASGKWTFWRKRVLIQQRQRGAWKSVKQVVLTKSWGAPAGYGGGYAGAFAEFNLSVPKGTLLRAVLPRSEARPCYLAGVSSVLRT